MNNWKRNNWRLSSGGDVKNKEDLINLDESMQNMEIKWVCFFLNTTNLSCSKSTSMPVFVSVS